MKMYLAIGGLEDIRFKLFNENKVEYVLVSFADVRARQHIKLPFKDILLDSGAYGVATNHQKITVQTYTMWLELYLQEYPQIQAYVNLDDLEDPKKSMDNLRYMEAHGLHPMPVYHYGEPNEVLNALCTSYEYVGLGGMAVGTMLTAKLKTFYEWAQETYKDNKFHIFGATAMNAFTKSQPYSLDSSSWCMGTKFGHIAGYKNGKPAWFDFSESKNGMKVFFTSYELWAANIRAMVDWSKLQWLDSNNSEPKEGNQIRML